MDQDFLNNMLKHAQTIQEQISQAKETAADWTVDAQSGGGMVKVTINGKHEVMSIQIDADAVRSQDVEMLEDLILSAVNQGMKKVNEKLSSTMAEIAGGLPVGDFLP